MIGPFDSEHDWDIGLRFVGGDEEVGPTANVDAGRSQWTDDLSEIL
jgi:hypothetical protein